MRLLRLLVAILCEALAITLGLLGVSAVGALWQAIADRKTKNDTATMDETVVGY